MTRLPALLLGVLPLITASAEAQSRGAVVGSFGATFGTEQSTVFGGEVNIQTGRRATAFISAGRIQSALPVHVQEAFDNMGVVSVSALNGIRYGLDAKIPVGFFSAGMKVFPGNPDASVARPYLSAGGGVARASAKIIDEELGDITEEFVTPAGVPVDELRETGAMFEFGGGLEVKAGARGIIDVGYRFRYLGREMKTSAVSGGFGLRF